MEAVDLIKSRRSVRKFKDEKVSKEVLTKIMEATRFAPSWANFQIARYTLVNDDNTIKKIAEDGVNDFVYNVGTLKNAKGVAVLSFVKGKSGKLGEEEYATNKESVWEVFDAGIACQTFCLAAHAYGVGTCIMGVINDKEIAKIVNLDEEETVAAIIVYGYPESEVAPINRKSIEEITRFI
jgi:nitroreductase